MGEMGGKRMGDMGRDEKEVVRVKKAGRLANHNEQRIDLVDTAEKDSCLLRQRLTSTRDDRRKEKGGGDSAGASARDWRVDI